MAKLLDRFPQLREHYAAAGGTDADAAADALSRFFELTRRTDAPLAMISPKVDLLWHRFIEFTEDYGGFCEQEYGAMIHHRPRTAATPVPDQAVRNFYSAYVAEFGHEIPPIWERGVPAEVVAYGRGKAERLPSNYRWSGWPGRAAAIAG